MMDVCGLNTKQMVSTIPILYLLTLNIDWFQPFTHIEYSIGAIYLAIKNLPRNERFKEENIILARVLPGPSEPKLSVNSYLGPLVEDLKTAWYNGIKVKKMMALRLQLDSPYMYSL